MSLPKQEGIVYYSIDYNLLKNDPENRDIKEHKIEKLMNSMRQIGFLKSMPIIVDKNYLVKAGQHRLEAARRLKIPYYWMIHKDVSMHEIRISETTGNTAWNPDDHGSSFARAGYDAYLLYQKFRSEFPLIPAMMAIIILSGVTGKDQKLYENFKNGKFKTIAEKRAWQMAEILYSLKEYYKGWTRRNFISAMLKVLSNPKFELSRFTRKLRYKHLRDQTKIEEYLSDIEEIYNYKEQNKISLKF